MALQKETCNAIATCFLRIRFQTIMKWMGKMLFIAASKKGKSY
jgi:hypothetical protein